MASNTGIGIQDSEPSPNRQGPEPGDAPSVPGASCSRIKDKKLFGSRHPQAKMSHRVLNKKMNKKTR
jgi:hypothetical protein